MHIFRKSFIRKQEYFGYKTVKKLREKELHAPDLEDALLALHKSIQSGSKKESFANALIVEKCIKKYENSSFFRKFRNFIGTLLIAIAAAALIRQTCFELYEVPTGSMRPTIKEQDRVFVSKLTYGLNIPFTTGHLFFSPDRVHRGDSVVITSENLDLSDTDTVYFSLFPGKKRYTKRLVALPGDTVYFYGGDAYILPKNEENVIHLLNDTRIPQREYIPFISSFEGRVEKQSRSPFSKDTVYSLKHFNIPIGKITFSNTGDILSQIPTKKGWVEEFSEEETSDSPKCFGEFFGINNYALCKVLLPNELPKHAQRLGYEDPLAVLYLEVAHSPTLPLRKRSIASAIPLVYHSTCWIPLHEEHVEKLLSALYTARFVVTDTKVSKYYFEPYASAAITFPRPLPNGTYEFFDGVAYSIGFSGHATILPKDHPIYPKSIEELAFWINYGIDFHKELAKPFSNQYPTRFVYFRQNNLFCMGHEILSGTDPILKNIQLQESGRQAKEYTYFAFHDAHSQPSASITPTFIKQYGLKIPEKQYLLLGDNPAMSLDSRWFGLVPEENIQGTPVLLFWPLSPRVGLFHHPHSFPSIYTILVLSLAFGALYIYMRHKKRFIKEGRAFLQKL